MTHALQFGGVPWLRPHLAEMLRELLGALELDPRGLLRVPDVTDLKKLLERVREDGLAMVVDRRRPARDARPRAVPSWPCSRATPSTSWTPSAPTCSTTCPALRSALGRRRHDRSGLLKLLEKLLGMDLKLRQYEQGKAFCDGVVARAGIEGLNRVWIGPEAHAHGGRAAATPRAGCARTEPLRLRRSA